MNTHKVAIVGASGYSGEELVRLLSRHPSVSLACVTSRVAAGRPLGEFFPQFSGTRYSALVFSPSDAGAVVESGASVAVLALPHGLAHEFAVPLLESGLRIIDLSADFRVHDAAVYKEFYAIDHPAPGLLKESVYGLPEIYAEEIRAARLVASPGCYPTSILLPLIPLLKRRILDPTTIIVTSLSGVSGAGKKAEVEYSFAECNESVRAYGVLRHRHLAEIEQELGLAAGQPVTISFAPHLIPVTRGIATTIHARPAGGADAAAVGRALQEAYADEPFVRLLGTTDFPDTKRVTGTNFIDIAWRHDPRTGRVILLSAEDNLIKGASGQAIQSLNILCGCAETDGLL